MVDVKKTLKMILSSLSTISGTLTTKLNKSGDTVTGRLKLGSLNQVAIGSYQSSQTTIANLVNEVRYYSGGMGSVNISTSYTKDSVTISTGWYNFLYIPHRTGGNNGADDGDNHRYGNLILFGMTVTGMYVLRITSGSVDQLKKVY